MFCTYCGKKIPDASRFCVYCGRRLDDIPAYSAALRASGADGTTPESNIRKTAYGAGPFTQIPEKEEAASETAYGAGASGQGSFGTSFPVQGRTTAEAPFWKESPQTGSWQKTKAKKNEKAALIAISVAALAAIVGVAALIVSLFPALPLTPQTSAGRSDGALSGKELAALSESVLILYVYDESGELLQTGSGFIAFDSDTLVTNYHVIAGGYSITACDDDEREYIVNQVIQYDEALDLAILQTEDTGLPVLPLADDSQVVKGEAVTAIGSPLGVINSVSTGIVSALWEEGGVSCIQTTAPISPGSSGGVLLNEYGEVIGITSATFTDAQNMNIAVSSRYAAALYGRNDLALSVTTFSEDYGPYGMDAACMGFPYNAVENSRWIFQNYNADNKIMQTDKPDGKTVDTGIKGTSLNLYKNKLYYLAGSNLLVYDPDSMETRLISVHDTDGRGLTIEGIDSYSNYLLYVSDAGILYGADVYNAETDETDYALYMLDFDGNVQDRAVTDFYATFMEDGFFYIDGDDYLAFVEYTSLNDPFYTYLEEDAYYWYPNYYSNGTLYHGECSSERNGEYYYTLVSYSMDDSTSETLLPDEYCWLIIWGVYDGDLYLTLGTEMELDDASLYRMPIGGGELDCINKGGGPISIGFAGGAVFFACKEDGAFYYYDPATGGVGSVR
jgi:S1-C subfamily serine protease